MLIAEAPTWTEAITGAAGIVAGTLLIGVIIWQIAKTLRTRASGAREDAYQKLAERATEAGESAAAGLERANEELSALRTRVEEVERILKQVD